MAEPLHIYLVERTDKVGWEEYIGYVACAASEEDALRLAPSGEFRPGHVAIRAVGVAINGAERGLVLKSFNAG